MLRLRSTGSHLRTADMDVPAFARMLAKIGYGFAVAHHGLFPLDEVPVLPFILGITDDGDNWVGSAQYRLDIEDARPTHAIAVGVETGTSHGIPLTIARVKLFAPSGATGYEIIVRTQSR